MRQLGLPGLVLAEAPSLESFWPGANGDAAAAVQQMADGARIPMVFLHGPGGVGKTHLLKAAWRRAQEAGRRGGYLPLEQALMLDPALIEGWGELDFVALDGIEHVAGFALWQRALFRLSEELRERDAGLLVAARHPPDALGLELVDLASRLAWGPVYALAPLDDADLAALAGHLARTRGLKLPDAVANFLVRRIARDPQHVALAIARLDEAALAAQRRLSIPFARSVLLDETKA
ncbi:MAG TPA: DnaA regulatory inactivator Hda [Gammaproteobacteria bacterium]|nr:DnaA regulatory inactivator Hda [Gammaproteobacteria bacterium]